MDLYLDDSDVTLMGPIIVAQTRGNLDPERIRARHARILQWHRATGCRLLLLNELHAEAPDYEAISVQRELAAELAERDFRAAVVVTDSRLAYFARLRIGDMRHRVFYHDLQLAAQWLWQEEEQRGVREAQGAQNGCGRESIIC